MYYFSQETILESFNELKDKVENKFLGIISILKSINSDIIYDNQTYCIEDGCLSEILDNICYLDTFNGKYSNSNLYIKFSTQWKELIKDTFIKRNPSIYSLIVFLYKFEGFENEPSYNDLLAKFCKDYHVTQSIVFEWFGQQKPQLTFTEEVLKRETLKQILGLSYSTLSFASPYSVSARAGELSRAPFIQTLYAGMDSIKCLMILKDDIDLFYNATSTKYIKTQTLSLQQIFYGAPGTGKSYTIQQKAPEEATIRTTFHPDSDYSTFVGAYKPTMRKTGVKNAVGNEEEKICYKFVPQAFLKAYIRAWDKYPEPQYLVIEEINRGNCAQIFGDIFQLLDRDYNGFSDYPIDADDDIRQYIAGENLKLGNCDLPDNLKNAIISGEKLILPNNLYVWATMNTSDQSLFPIDSAFKRRWDWIYIPIANVPSKNWKIKVDKTTYDWWTFVDKINTKIQTATESQDKKLGYFFATADATGIIDVNKFVGKVLFYLWNDVLRDYPLEGDDLLKDGGSTLVFEDFFNEDGSVNTDKVKLLLSNLGVEANVFASIPIDIDDENDEEEDEGRDMTKYSINGDGPYPKKNLLWEIVKKYIANNPEVTANEILKEFVEIKDMVSHGIETQEEYNARTDKEPRVKEVAWNGEKLYVSTNGWGTKEKMAELMGIVNNKPWNITITEA